MAIDGNAPNSRPMVVVVDDDAAVRNSLQFSLEVEGFRVRTYPSAKSLLSNELDSECSCLIVDQNMPGMTGLALLAALRERGVATPAILICGHVTAMLRNAAERAHIPLVEKPFLGNGLLDQVRAAVAGKGREG
jgi:two-component system, LuxR family, response regulator FixJ